jgi:hypothetical protein
MVKPGFVTKALSAIAIRVNNKLGTYRPIYQLTLHVKSSFGIEQNRG